ncbi:histidine kinase [Ekhidna sp.]|jgi:sensor histidine kinase YesM|uniref:sensor histidine kinase n=1 Tax=Ekhidna sp. TaxID=2608089 RepID=UPI0032EE92FB
MKYWYRLTIGVFVFLFFKLTRDDFRGELFHWDLGTSISLVYTVIVILALWEIVARYIRATSNKTGINSNKGLYILSTKATLLMLPLVFLFAYIYDNILQYISCCPEHYYGSFLINTAQGFVISLLIIAYEIINLYVRNAIKNAREKEQIQKELAAAKLESLKNQVNPHFLFNSFSVLTSLVEEDSKTAVKFISKLSDMYRYILENDEKTVVTLEEELAFIDSYTFLLSMRHRSAIVVHKHLDLPSKEILIPPMSIQVLIENAVKHNSFSIDEPLHIIVKNDGQKAIIVENEKRKKEHLTSSTQIGLKNLSKRLILSAGKALEILDNEQTFQVRLPLSRA